MVFNVHTMFCFFFFLPLHDLLCSVMGPGCLFFCILLQLFQFHPDFTENPLTWAFAISKKSSFIFIMAIKLQNDRGESEWENVREGKKRQNGK